jgi:hypothetical protein
MTPALTLPRSLKGAGPSRKLRRPPPGILGRITELSDFFTSIALARQSGRIECLTALAFYTTDAGRPGT